MINIYAPQKKPGKSLMLITFIVLASIVAGVFISRYFIAAALIFWIHYTVVLSYLQFKHKSRHTYKSLTEYLLHPQIRFFIFETLAVMGLFALFVYDQLNVGIITLIIWWLFAFNFYRNYKSLRRYEAKTI